MIQIPPHIRTITQDELLRYQQKHFEAKMKLARNIMATAMNAKWRRFFHQQLKTPDNVVTLTKS